MSGQPQYNQMYPAGQLNQHHQQQHHNQHHSQHPHPHPHPHPHQQLQSGLPQEYTVGTINPAALNPAMLAGPPQLTNASPRGLKRSRTPDQAYQAQTQDGYGSDDDQARRKRGRPRKSGSDEMSPPLSAKPVMPPQQQQAQQPQLPQLQQPPLHMPPQQPQSNVKTPQLVPHTLPSPVSTSQVSPPKATPTKPAVVKALPTVRDHTTDRLNEEGDEYIPREHDESGDRKVDLLGNLTGTRKYRCKTFFVPGRGQKLFMLATECARVLGYRDSYLLFNKNRSLYKIIASQPEKDDLIAQEILPYSYRSRQIAIVTARSMFRQFGSRVIEDGRRVRDDYWEAKARKQGFTEEDLAGEKRPGAAKLRAQQMADQNGTAVAGDATNNIIYHQDPGHLEGHPHAQNVHLGMGQGSGAPLPMISLAPEDQQRMKEIGMVPRPRQEMNGPPYQDRLQPTPQQEILQHSGQGAEYNKMLNQNRKVRGNSYEEFYKEPRIPPVNPQQMPQNDAAVTQSMNSPQVGAPLSQQPQMMQPQHAPQMMSPRAYQQQYPPQGNAQSPIRQMHPNQPMRSDQYLQQRSPVHPQHQAPAPNTYNHYSQAPQHRPQPPMFPPQQPPAGMHLSQYAHAPTQQPGQAAPQHHQQTPQPPQAHQVPQQGVPSMQAPMYPASSISPLQNNYPGNMYQNQGAPHHYMPQQQHQPQQQQQAQPGQPAMQQNWRPPQGSWGYMQGN